MINRLPLPKRSILKLTVCLSVSACSTDSNTNVRNGKINYSNMSNLTQDTKLNQKDLIIETTGKPTQLYDPTSDVAVRDAFGKIYDSNTYSVAEYSRSGSDNFQSYSVLVEAAQKQRLSLAATGCQMIVDANCDVGWRVIPCNNLDKTCLPTLVPIANRTQSGCMIDDKEIYANSAHPIGRHFFSASAYSDIYDENKFLSEKEQLQNYFAIECTKIEEKMP